MKVLFVFVLFLSIPLFSYGQVNGRISDKKGAPIQGAVLTLSHEVVPDSLLLIGYSISKGDGSFRIDYTAPTETVSKHKTFWLEARLMGFRPQKKRVHLGQEIAITLEEDVILLKEVTVMGEPVRRSNDTITYVVDLLKRQSDKTLEEVLRRLPGVSVGPMGEISVHGKPINKFYIEGLDMLGSDYNLVTQNVHPKDIASVQILSDHQPIKLLKDIELSDASAINIKLKEKSKLRPVGKGYLAGGYDRRPIYDALLFTLLVRQSRQHLVTLESNAIGKLNPSRQNIQVRSNTQFIANSFIPSGLLESQPVGIPSIPMGHYRDNYSAGATAHSLFKLTDDSRLAPQLSYSYDTDNYTIQRKTITSGLGATPITIEEGSNQTNSKHTLQSSIDYELNKDNVYINNTAIGFATLGQSQIGLKGGNISEQRNSLREYQLLNNFSYMHRSTLIRRVEALLSWHHAPTHHLTLIDRSQGTTRQIAEGSQLFGGLSYNIDKQLFGFLDSSLGVAVSAESNSIRTANTTSTHRNTIRSTHLKASINPGIKYQKESWILSATLPLSMQLFHMRDLEDSSSKFIKLFIPEYALYARFTPNAYWTFTLQNRHGHSFGNAGDYLLHPIQRDFREIIIVGSGLFRHNQTNSTSFSTKFNDPINGYYITSLTNYMKHWYNSSNNTDIGVQHSTTEVVTHQRETNRLNQSLQLGKVFFQIRTSFSLNIDYTYMDNRIYRTGKPIDIKNHLISAKANISTSLFRDVLASDIEAVYFRQTSSQQINTGLSSTSSIDLCKLSAKVRVYFSKVFSIFGVYNGVWEKGITQDNYKPYHHSSIGAEYQGNGWELELLLSNLANQKEYIDTSYRGLDYYETNTLLRPRQLLLRWTYRY